MKTSRIFCFFAFIVSLSVSHAQLSTISMSAGQRSALALRSDGTVWAWGTNQVGELGLGTNTLISSPKRVSNLTNVIAISAGPLHSLAVQGDGTVMAWGANGNGRLGNGTFNNASNPVAVATITNAITVAAGGNHSLAVLADGRVMAWGTNSSGQLGTGNTTSTNKPVAVGNFANVIAVAAGTNFSLALTRNGDVWSWGTNDMGQLGLGNTTPQLSPVKITTLSNIMQIVAGSSHALALGSNGTVYVWGRNTEGQLGDGTTANVVTPKISPSFGTATNYGLVKWVAAGYNSSAAVLKTGRLFYWGWYGNGTLYASNMPPQELNANSGFSFQNVTYGDSYLLAEQADGSTWAWGFNQYGQRGNGNVYDPSDTWRYESGNAEFSFSASPHPVVTRFNQGDRNDINYAPNLPYNTFVLPLDMETGVRLDNQGSDLYSYGANTPWFLKVQKTQRLHAWQLIGATTNLSRFPVDNPIVAFGSDAGGSPLYVGQPYTFGISAGAYDENTGQTNRIRILVYDRAVLASGATNIAPTNIITIALPRRYSAADSNAWSNFVTSGNRVVVETNGLRTVVQFAEGPDYYSSWGLGWVFVSTPTPNINLCGYKLTQMATSTNYCYVVEAIGSCEVGANVFAPMGVTNSTGSAYMPLYAIGFDNFPAWRSHFIDNPNFAGTPLPPTYAGRSLAELSGMMAVITNNIWITNNSAYTNLDNSPELRRHPILDQFVNDMGRDPLALANYVINEIGLTDPMAMIEQSKKVADSIEVGGVNRSALGTFLEKQGSPTEQCALLVYLLRQAGYSAAFVWPTNSNLKLLDTTVSRLWQIQVHGVISYSGIPVITNSLITVNYPWVVANIGTNSVQIFPWLKNTEIVEGQDVYDYLPTNYPDAYSWVKDYALANPALTSLGTPNDGIAKIWQSYLTQVINTNKLQSNLSLDDFGVRAFNRRNTYTSWSLLPLPNVLTNQAQVAVVQTLSDSAVTYPFLTNIFDSVRIEVFQTDTNTANKLFDSGAWRTCDLHNRKLLLYTNVPNNLSLWLSAYRPSITNALGFTNFNTGTNSLCVQLLQSSIASNVTNLPVRLTFLRRDATLSSPSSWFPQNENAGGYVSLNCSKNDLSAVIPLVARVTPAMLQVHAEDYWRLQQQRATNTSFIPAVTDEAGDAAMIMASTFYQKLWDDDQFNQCLHKVRGLTFNSFGFASLTHLANNQMQVKMSMNWINNVVLGNAKLRQDSGDRGFSSLNNYLTMLQAYGSSAEHSVISSVWGDQNPVSTIRLLQIAAERWRTNALAAPIELNIKNYAALGGQTYTGYGATTLKNQVPAVWNRVTNVFATMWDSNFLRVLITPGQVTNSPGSFKGMSALIFGQWATGAIISDNQTTLNGGFSGDLFAYAGYGDFIPSYDLTYNLQYSPSLGSFTFTYNNFSFAQPRFDFSQYDALKLTAPAGTTAQIAFTPQQTIQGSIIAGALNLPSSSTAGAIKAEKDSGWFGRAWAGIKQAGSIVSDPVQVVSGDFYADSVDVALAGPMPLQLRRNYQSRNLADSLFGAGWKMNIMPWLVLTTNATSNILLYAAEMDGAVLAYRFQSNSVWTVIAADNPSLVNNGGSTANLFNNRIQQNATNSQIYVLMASDGSKRTYQVMASFAMATGTNQLNRVRPYLTRWEDHAGNYCQFFFGTNAASNDFGQLYRIQSANGASLTFKYDFYGRITQAITDDNRLVSYQYDTYGDLVAVTLPDYSTWQYGYQHYTFTTNSQSYTDSYHLLTTETKPNGRQLVNTYDNLRRVTMQQATVGINRELITNAWFFYTNDCTALTNDSITGVTRVEDVFHNPYSYYYTNNLITQIVEPLGRTNTQNWYIISETNKSGYYPNSLELAVDVRGLTNAFFYDSSGNLTNQTTTGDLIGSGTGSQSATNSYSFTTNNCPATANDASGNQSTFIYDSTDAYRLANVQLSSSGIGITTNRWFYTNVTSVVDMGGWFKTNSSFGLCFRETKADAATNEWVYNGRGFPTQFTRYAATADVVGNADPSVTTYLAFTPRGDLATATDASGRQVQMNYDSVGRLQWRDVFDENSNSIARETYYYNRNGDLEWYDGARSNPDDFTWFSYDGAGRKVQQIQWRSRAKADGSGIEAETGDNLYATTFFAYDPFGNLTTLTDPRGAVTTNVWDALGRLTQRKSFDTDGVTTLATESFAYEVGGQVRFYTNALNGVTEIRYTSTGQPSFRQNADGSTNGWTYYLDGRLRREVQGNGAYWETTYKDAARTVTRIFYSATGVPQATNSTVFDRRGNSAQWVDAGGNTFTNFFDGLGRLKSAVGPATISIFETGSLPNSGIYTTNIFQQITTYLYDSSGKTLTVSNALGEKTTTTFDALGRTLAVQTYAAGSGTPLRTSAIAYAADNSSFTATTGSGANAISATTYLDTEGRTLLSVASPSANLSNLILKKYDLAGNLSAETQASLINNSLTTWQTSAFAYDGLNRVKTLTERDNAVTTFSYDSAGDLTNRVMPGATLTWSATYNNAGQILTDKDSNGGSFTRNNAYTYFAAGSPFAGLLNSVTDGVGVTRTGTYDTWLRVTNVTTSGSLAEQQMAVGWQYDARGFITGLTQSFASTNTGATTTIARSFDAYGQLGSESINLGGVGLSGFSQTWDAAGRRIQLAAGYSWIGNFLYRADGLMTAGGGGTFGYADNGLLTGRTNGFRTFTINQRDGVGRPLQATTTVGFSTALTESWNWLGDGSPAVYIAQRSDFTDTRKFAYGSLNRRLTQESFNVGSSQFVTNAYTFDNGLGGGMGVLTKATENSSTANSWSGGLDTFSRIGKATNSVAHRPAYGKINGKAIITALLDNRPVAVTVAGTNGGQWRATLDLTPGTHQLTTTAVHPSGLFVTNAAVTFTNNSADTLTNTFDGNGQITQRLWLSANGQTNRIQTLAWDAFNRLVKVSERDSQSSGYNWQADFDPLGRRIRTTTINVTNGVALNYQPTAIVSYYDPQVEFQEIGVSVNGGLTTWKNFGPDLDGLYGSQQGLGGLESLTTGFNTVGLVQDSFGNVIGSVTNMAVTWNAARVNSYGAVAGYPALSLESAPLTAEHLAWRGKWRDITSLYYWGARPYDSERRGFLSADPYGHPADDSLYSAFYGSPTVYWDADGRFGKQAFKNINLNPNARTFAQAASLLDYYSANTASPIGGGTAEFFSHFAHMAVDNGSPANYVNQGMVDYQAGGTLNVANRYNPLRSPFQAVSGVNLMQGEGFGERLSTLDRSVDWLNTVALVSSAGAGLLKSTTVVRAAPPILGTSEESLLLPAPRAAAAWRNTPGTAFGNNLSVIGKGQQWLRGTGADAGRIPGQIAKRLSGRQFNAFDNFREAFWKAVAADSDLSQQFGPSSLREMTAGRAPFAPASGQVGGRIKYEIDHLNEIQNGGGVYDMNNLIIRTPLNHVGK